MLSIIVAVAENNSIGKDNNLLWRLPGDLKRFKEIHFFLYQKFFLTDII